MTEAEWKTTADYLALLIYLRGDVDVEQTASGVMPGLHCSAGYLPYGPAQRTSSRKLRLVAAAISRRWWDVSLDEPSRNLLVAYQAFLNESGTWDEFVPNAIGYARGNRCRCGTAATPATPASGGWSRARAPAACSRC
jgi:hypothetical protein